mmetsp:Transcript_70991/g.169383  ORF Transcript_70991/g.169383 Transcript_70991/m.169383 type:complete len:295 (-) Transcript_70991:277-1161(-)
MAWWQKPRSFRAAGRRPQSQSRPNTALTAEVEDFLQEILKEDDAGKANRVNAEEQLQRNALQVALGPLHKTGKKLTDHTATGGLYLKYRACRTTDDIASKALTAESVDRMLAETNPGSPSVRTVLRVTDDLSLKEQTRSTDTDDLAHQIIGTSSASYMDAVLRLGELRNQAAISRSVKQEKAELNLSRVAYESMYGLRTRVMEDDHRSQVRASRRASGLVYDANGRRSSRRSLQSADEEEELASTDEDELEDSFRKFDKWTTRHLRRRKKSRPRFTFPSSPRPVLDMSLVGLRP